MKETETQTRRILVVDDEEGLRLTLAANLELEGFEVLEARDGREALELCERHSFDLVLSDIRMPEIDGLELLKRLRASHPDLPVVLMTAFTTESDVENAILRGVFTVLSKPCDVSVVAQVVTRALQRCAVLVVDDVERDARSMAEALLAAGVRARAVFDGASALEAVRSGTVDVCLTDLKMPEMDGVAVLEQISQVAPSVAVIAFSAYDVPEMMHRVAARGAFRCLRKPMRTDDIMAVIAQARAASPRAAAEQ